MFSSKKDLGVHVMIDCVNLTIKLHVSLNVDVALIIAIGDKRVLLRTFRRRSSYSESIPCSIKWASIFPDANLVNKWYLLVRISFLLHHYGLLHLKLLLLY